MVVGGGGGTVKKNDWGRRKKKKQRRAWGQAVQGSLQASDRAAIEHKREHERGERGREDGDKKEMI